MRKVLIIGTGLSESGGVSTHMNFLLNSTLRNCFNLSNLNVASTANENLLRKYLRVILIPIRLFFKLFIDKPDMLHVNPSFDSKAFFRDSVCVIIGKLCKKKIIIQFHGGKPKEFFQKWSWFRWYIHYVIRSSDKVIVLSEVVAKEITSIVPAHKLVKIPNTVNTQMYFNKSLLVKDVGSSKIKIIFLSRFLKTKGVYDIIEAIPMVVKECPLTIFVFAGSGKEEDNLRNISKSKKLTRYIEFLGYVKGDKKVRALISSDIFVLPTYSEGFPYVLAEAMAAGLPIITCDEGAISEYVQDGVNGFIIPSKRPDVLAKKIVLLIKNMDLRTRMGRLNRKIAVRKLDTNLVVDQYKNIYDELLVAN